MASTIVPVVKARMERKEELLTGTGVCFALVVGEFGRVGSGGRVATKRESVCGGCVVIGN
jgi:hypothetical protein